MTETALSLDEATRPSAPKLPQVTETQREAGRHLAAIHRAYLSDMARIKMVLERIEAGDAPPEHLQQVVLSLDMAQNYRAFGSLCGQGCQILTMHHNIEEQSMFPGIERRAVEGIRAVVARLREEHKVVHALIELLQQASVDLIDTPSEATFAAASNAFTQLEAVVRSHFRYEETELEEAIGVYLDSI
ncbi:MAG: hemerythrin domain-containing protein [Pseudomonadota bacterium]